MPHDQRQRTFIDVNVQGALARRLIWHWCLFLVAACGATFLLETFLNPFEPFNIKMNRMWSNHGPFLLTAVFLVPVFVRDAVRLSHRFVGPISRLRANLRELAADPAKSRPMKLRPGDFWQEVADEYNAVRDRLVELHQVCEDPCSAASSPAGESEMAVR